MSGTHCGSALDPKPVPSRPRQPPPLGPSQNMGAGGLAAILTRQSTNS